MSIQPLTLQQVFDNALNVMRARNYKPAYDPDADGGAGGCMYRSSIGPCVIGASIPDELYDPLLENTSAVDIVKGDPYDLVHFECDPDLEATPELQAKLDGLKVLFSYCSGNALASMQMAHDDMQLRMTLKSRREVFEEKMRQLAIDNDLRYTPPSNT